MKWVFILAALGCPVSLCGAEEAAPDRTAGGTRKLYAFPYLAEELNDDMLIFRGKKVHSASGPQKRGYDLDAVRPLSSGGWTRVKPGFDPQAPENADFLVYGRKVHAMSGGKVVRCWRMAPENLRPFSKALGDRLSRDFEDRTWLHEALRRGMMPEHGNHLFVAEPDGDLVLYAHARPGTIPKALCPHRRTLYVRAGDESETDVPPEAQATVRTGQFLFRTGNSGNSTAPHLHVHRQSARGRPLVLRFARGQFKRIKAKKAVSRPWQSFAGEPLPGGPILIRPGP